MPYIIDKKQYEFNIYLKSHITSYALHPSGRSEERRVGKEC